MDYAIRNTKYGTRTTDHGTFNWEHFFMDIGMLWYDDDTKRPLGEKVSRAVEYYKTKYGRLPTVCFVNPVTLKDAPENAAGVQLRSARNVMVDHFWLGVGDTNGSGEDHAAKRKKAPAARGTGRAAQASA